MMNASSKSYCPYSLHLSIVDQTWRAPLLLMYHHRPFGLRGDQLITAPKQMENFVVFSPAIRLTFRIQVKTLYSREFVYSSTVAILIRSSWRRSTCYERIVPVFYYGPRSVCKIPFSGKKLYAQRRMHTYSVS